MSADEDLSRPPFAIVDSLAPAGVGAEIVECFDRIALRADLLECAHALAMRSAGIADDEPIRRAGTAIARDVDRGIGAGITGGYHNARHFAEVVLCALYLSRIARLAPHRIARVATAALIHDFHHDGSRSAASPFRLEALSSSRADGYLVRAEVAPDLRAQLCALVLATEPRAGVIFARKCLEHHANGASPPSTVDVPDALDRLLVDPDLAFEAVLLAEADVLPSIGLTVDHGQYVQDSLAAEWNADLGPADKLAFVDRVRGAITIGDFFAPNISALRQAYVERLPTRDK